MFAELVFERLAPPIVRNRSGMPGLSRAAQRLLRIGLEFLDRHHAHGGRIAQAALGEFNYFFGDELGYRVGAVGQAKCAASVEKCRTHRFDQFRIEGLPA